MKGKDGKKGIKGAIDLKTVQLLGTACKEKVSQCVDVVTDRFQGEDWSYSAYFWYSILRRTLKCSVALKENVL